MGWNGADDVFEKSGVRNGLGNGMSANVTVRLGFDRKKMSRKQQASMYRYNSNHSDVTRGISTAINTGSRRPRSPSVVA